MFECVSVHVSSLRARVCACVRVCVHVRVRARICFQMRARLRVQVCVFIAFMLFLVRFRVRVEIVFRFMLAFDFAFVLWLVFAFELCPLELETCHLGHLSLISYNTTYLLQLRRKVAGIPAKRQEIAQVLTAEQQRYENILKLEPVKKDVSSWADCPAIIRQTPRKYASRF